MALIQLRGYPVVEDPKKGAQEGFCPFCACPLNPGERVCLDCLFDVRIAEAE